MPNKNSDSEPAILSISINSKLNKRLILMKVILYE